MEGKYGKEGQVEAEKRYTEIAKGFGWDEASTTQASTSSKTAQSADEEINFDSDEEDLRKGPTRPVGGSSREGGSMEGGMSVKVSVMAQPATSGDVSIHGLTVGGDAERLKTLLEIDPSIDINEKDDYVSAHSI